MTGSNIPAEEATNYHNPCDSHTRQNHLISLNTTDGKPITVYTHLIGMFLMPFPAASHRLRTAWLLVNWQFIEDFRHRGEVRRSTSIQNTILCTSTEKLVQLHLMVIIIVAF